MRKGAKKLLKPLKLQLKTSFLAYDYDIQFKPLQRNNIYQIVMCGMFCVKQTKLELLYAQKFQKR